MRLLIEILAIIVTMALGIDSVADIINVIRHKKEELNTMTEVFIVILSVLIIVTGFIFILQDLKVITDDLKVLL